MVSKSETYYDYNWDQNYLERYIDKIKPLAEAAEKDGKKAYLIAGSDGNMIQSLLDNAGLDIEYYTADYILLETMIRSNPGVLLLKESVILDKFHYKKLPDYDQVKSKHNF